MFLLVILIVVLAVCTYTDIRSRKIYNVIIYPALLITLVIHLITQGWGAVLSSVIGLAVGFAILLIPYLMGGMGAGDVKLLALIGAIKGTEFVIQTSIYMALIGAFMALFILLFRKGRLRSIWNFIINRFVGVKTPLFLDKRKLYPYGVAIAGGALVTLILNGKFIIWL